MNEKSDKPCRLTVRPAEWQLTGFLPVSQPVEQSVVQPVKLKPLYLCSGTIK
ncbi:MAG: hypothetical protein HOP23_03465 [Methylococcaceae bacterium]|nr:hypothetical protein [Methylococcaceae bacterium]